MDTSNPLKMGNIIITSDRGRRVLGEIREWRYYHIWESAAVKIYYAQRFIDNLLNLMETSEQ